MHYSDLVVVAIVALSIATSSGEETASGDHDDSHTSHWGYEAGNGPGDWSSMNPEWLQCAGGRRQSPIDLTNATETQLPATVIHTLSEQEVEVLNQSGVIRELDNGHTIQVNSKTGETMTVGDETYALLQFHFHAPSEHTVDGEHFPMEMHFVYQAADGALAVAGLFIDEGAENPSIVPLWAQLPEAAGTETTIRIPAGFDEDIFPDVGTGFYHYEGSLTTPPCSEGVKWYVRTTPTRLSKGQIASFTARYDHNNRPIQAPNGRALYLDKNSTVTVY
jgi:carbonic anhydrase